MAKFEIFKNAKGQFHFRLKAGNGQIILASEGYVAKESCKKGIASVMKNSKSESQFNKLMSKNKKYYFNLKAGNGQIIGTSEMYDSEANRDKGIESIKKSASSSSIVDLTVRKKR